MLTDIIGYDSWMKILVRHRAWVGLVMLMAVAIAPKAQVPGASAEGAGLTGSRVFPFANMPERKTANGGESRDVLRGVLATGEVVAVHESMQPAGATPVPLHVIQHSELILVQEGTVGFEHDGTTEKVGPGGVIYVALGTLHRIRNVGNGPAKYFVVQVGGDTRR